MGFPTQKKCPFANTISFRGLRVSLFPQGTTDHETLPIIFKDLKECYEEEGLFSTTPLGKHWDKEMDLGLGDGFGPYMYIQVSIAPSHLGKAGNLVSFPSQGHIRFLGV